MSILKHKKDIIYQQLKEDIILGKYPAGMKLPKELDFARDLGVGKITLRAALKRLDDEGLIARIPSKGTFVVDQSQNQKKGTKILVISNSNLEKESPNNYILPGIENTVAKLGYDTILCDDNFFNSISVDELKKSLKENSVIGIILLAANYDGNEILIKKLAELQCPVVLPHASPSDSGVTGFATIRILQDKAWIDAIRHLYSQNHKRVATLAIKKDTFRGFSEAEHIALLKAYDMSTDKELIGYAPYDPERISEVVNRWLKLPELPTAILCYSDFLAIDVYEALKEKNIKIPDKIAVMGCCGFPGGNFLSPSLSTIDFEYGILGKMSVELILQADEWFDPYKAKAAPILIKPHKLLVRESTAVKQPESQYMQYVKDAIQA